MILLSNFTKSVSSFIKTSIRVSEQARRAGHVMTKPARAIVNNRQFIDERTRLEDEKGLAKKTNAQGVQGGDWHCSD